VALRHARDAGLDLVEINSSVDPPICRLMDYDKWADDKRRKEKEEKDKLRRRPVEERRADVFKELKLTARIGTGDLEVKARTANSFMDKGYKVRRCSETPGSPRLVVARSS